MSNPKGTAVWEKRFSYETVSLGFRVVGKLLLLAVVSRTLGNSGVVVKFPILNSLRGT